MVLQPVYRYRLTPCSSSETNSASKGEFIIAMHRSTRRSRFSLLLLDHGELYLEDHGCFFHPASPAQAQLLGLRITPGDPRRFSGAARDLGSSLAEPLGKKTK